MSVITLLEKIFPFFFNAAKKEYDSLPQPEKDSLKHGSGIIDVLNTEAGKAPAEITTAIIARFPDLTEPVIESSVIELANTFNLNVTSFDDAVTKVQAYFNSKSAGIWEGIVQSAANMLAVILSPGTVFAKIGSLMQYVYDDIIKKK